MADIEGLHHVTAIAGEPQTNINFYTGVLGLRLVKLTGEPPMLLLLCCCVFELSKRQSQQGACLAKVEPRAPRHERRRVAVADVAEKIRFHMSFREELLLAGITFARRKELLIEFCVIKA